MLLVILFKLVLLKIDKKNTNTYLYNKATYMYISLTHTKICKIVY